MQPRQERALVREEGLGLDLHRMHVLRALPGHISTHQPIKEAHLWHCRQRVQEPSTCTGATDICGAPPQPASTGTITTLCASSSGQADVALVTGRVHEGLFHSQQLLPIHRTRTWMEQGVLSRVDPFLYLAVVRIGMGQDAEAHVMGSGFHPS